MNKLWLVMLTAILLVPNCVKEPSHPSQFNLDHFKAYRVILVKANEPKEVSIKDQFITEPERVTPDKITHFLLPVSKKAETGESSIINQQNHLGWYPLDLDTLEINFEFSNQFTNFNFTRMVVKNVKAILVPTEKIKKDSRFPENLDHYLCYQRVEGERTTTRVTLGDQFQKNITTTATGPEYFCTPCSKDGKEINNNDDHLAVYTIGVGEPAREPVTITNQFGDQSFEVSEQVFLLVPSKKRLPSSGK
jgi:hypothetical protein